ncbi:MAG: serine hydrolase [Chloroflexi bacterium HGW-Chloroflexi-8]|nr:MAG: serine hydrolase [Chloroflexi bacterium HGW-Chloroflexi-8]
MTDFNLLLDQLRTELRTPALAAIVTDSRSILAAGAIGVRQANRIESVELTDLFQIGSNAKAMTATVCAMLVEQGILSWDLTPAAVFTELARTILPEYHQITLEMLLSHTSGIPPYTDTDEPDFILPDFDFLSITSHIQHFANFLMTSCPILGRPGEKVMYSNAGCSLAAAMAERVSGQMWSELIQDRLFHPFNFRGYVGYEHPARISPDQPWGHILDEGGVFLPHSPKENLIPACLVPAGDMCISMPEYARFLQMQLDILRDQLSSFAPLFNHGKPGVGAGWGVNYLRGMESLGLFSLHAGSTGTFFAIAALSHQHSLGFSIVVNGGLSEMSSALKMVISSWVNS